MLNRSCLSDLLMPKVGGFKPLQATVVRCEQWSHLNQTSHKTMTNMETFFDGLGLVGSFLVSAALVPQIIKVYRSKSAKDISKSFQSVFVVGITCITVYGMGEGLWPIWIPSTLELLGGIILLVMKHYYDWCDAKRVEIEQKEALEAVAAEEAILKSPTVYAENLTPRGSTNATK
ncbi:hypothetical protein V7S43_010939 [Phytophthora oleae]|uniref:PQ-loop repeat-containing protein n=1 Tax=Phytophthora oleae TaxID=2107226 RepID=A0ABD3FAW8_9STRA